MGAVLLKPAEPGTEIVRNLLTAKDRLTGARRVASEAREHVREIERRIREAEAEAILEIALETGPTGKPRFPNETLREAELVRRKARDPEFRRLEAALAAARRELQEAEDALASAHDDFKAWQIVAKLVAAELAAGGGAC